MPNYPPERHRSAQRAQQHAPRSTSTTAPTDSSDKSRSKSRGRGKFGSGWAEEAAQKALEISSNQSVASSDHPPAINTIETSAQDSSICNKSNPSYPCPASMTSEQTARDTRVLSVSNEVYISYSRPHSSEESAHNLQQYFHNSQPDANAQILPQAISANQNMNMDKVSSAVQNNYNQSVRPMEVAQVGIAQPQGKHAADRNSRGNYDGIYERNYNGNRGDLHNGQQNPRHDGQQNGQNGYQNGNQNGYQDSHLNGQKYGHQDGPHNGRQNPRRNGHQNRHDGYQGQYHHGQQNGYENPHQNGQQNVHLYGYQNPHHNGRQDGYQNRQQGNYQHGHQNTYHNGNYQPKGYSDDVRNSNYQEKRYSDDVRNQSYQGNGYSDDVQNRSYSRGPRNADHSQSYQNANKSFTNKEMYYVGDQNSSQSNSNGRQNGGRGKDHGYDHNQSLQQAYFHSEYDGQQNSGRGKGGQKRGNHKSNGGGSRGQSDMNRTFGGRGAHDESMVVNGNYNGDQNTSNSFGQGKRGGRSKKGKKGKMNKSFGGRQGSMNKSFRGHNQSYLDVSEHQHNQSSVGQYDFNVFPNNEVFRQPQNQQMPRNEAPVHEINPLDISSVSKEAHPPKKRKNKKRRANLNKTLPIELVDETVEICFDGHLNQTVDYLGPAGNENQYEDHCYTDCVSVVTDEDIDGSVASDDTYYSDTSSDNNFVQEVPDSPYYACMYIPKALDPITESTFAGMYVAHSGFQPIMPDLYVVKQKLSKPVVWFVYPNSRYTMKMPAEFLFNLFPTEAHGRREVYVGRYYYQDNFMSNGERRFLPNRYSISNKDFDELDPWRYDRKILAPSTFESVIAEINNPVTNAKAMKIFNSGPIKQPVPLPMPALEEAEKDTEQELEDGLEPEEEPQLEPTSYGIESEDTQVDPSNEDILTGEFVSDTSKTPSKESPSSSYVTPKTQKDSSGNAPLTKSTPRRSRLCQWTDEQSAKKSRSSTPANVVNDVEACENAAGEEFQRQTPLRRSRRGRRVLSQRAPIPVNLDMSIGSCRRSASSPNMK